MRATPSPRRNPSEPLTPTERQELVEARRLAKRFHGAGGHVVEVPASQRCVSRFLVAVGKLAAFDYEPEAPSTRAAWRWHHQTGDRGPGRPKSPNEPEVGVDPLSRRLVILPAKSPMRFSSRRGFIG